MSAGYFVEVLNGDVVEETVSSADMTFAETYEIPGATMVEVFDRPPDDVHYAISSTEPTDPAIQVWYKIP